MKKLDTFLEVKQVSITYSRWGQNVVALNEIDLVVPQGQWLILVGPNGSGKSTLLKTISARVNPNKGKVLIKNKNVSDMSANEISNSVFHVHQDPLKGTAPTLTVFENLYVAESQKNIAKGSKIELIGKYEKMLREIGLQNRLRQPAMTLSGGERQLLALLIARLRPAPLILLDEPFAALDPSKTEICLKEIFKLNAAGKTLIQVTHNPEYAVTMGDRTIVIDSGEIVHDEFSSNRSIDSIKKYWFNPTRG
jgi:putative tryptophan/tyrosine transport system ATP-binding protein